MFLKDQKNLVGNVQLYYYIEWKKRQLSVPLFPYLLERKVKISEGNRKTVSNILIKIVLIKNAQLNVFTYVCNYFLASDILVNIDTLLVNK